MISAEAARGLGRSRPERPPGLPRLRHRPPGARAAELQLQQPLRRLPAARAWASIATVRGPTPTRQSPAPPATARGCGPRRGAVRVGGQVDRRGLVRCRSTTPRRFFDGLDVRPRPSSRSPGRSSARSSAGCGSSSEVGLGYLTLGRGSDTLSGGELQRARLATQLGSGLVGVCYVLDEPTAGLHPRDTDRLIASLRGLQRPGQQRARRRARRGHDPGRRLGDRPRPRRRPRRRPDRRARAARISWPRRPSRSRAGTSQRASRDRTDAGGPARPISPGWIAIRGAAATTSRTSTPGFPWAR